MFKIKYIMLFFVLLIATIYFNPARATEGLNDKEYEERQCLVEAIYFEARSESLLAQLAIANVILERVKLINFPNTVCDVVKQGRYYKGHPVKHKCAFSYWCDGKSEKMHNQKAKQNAIKIAAMAASGVLVDQTLYATHYHATYVNPYWASNENFERVAQIGVHIFYIQH
jgi:spore germination cell wall hydrolase CwlJ-like protein